jgi:hypothetical protein
MPIYTLKNKDTGEIFEKRLSIAEYNDYLKLNSNIERYYTSIPNVADSTRLMDGQKPPADFQKYVIGRMKASIPQNTLGNRKYSIPTEI